MPSTLFDLNDPRLFSSPMKRNSTSSSSLDPSNHLSPNRYKSHHFPSKTIRRFAFIHFESKVTKIGRLGRYTLILDRCLPFSFSNKRVRSARTTYWPYRTFIATAIYRSETVSSASRQAVAQRLAHCLLFFSLPFATAST